MLHVCFHPERLVPHKLFTPLLSGMVATGILLTLILMVLLYKYVQVTKKNFYNTVTQYQRGNASISVNVFLVSLANSIKLTAFIINDLYVGGKAFGTGSSLHSNGQK